MADICSAQTSYKGFGATCRFAAQVTVTPAAVGASSVASQTGTVTGLKTDMVLAWKTVAPATNAGLINIRCSAANVAQFDFVNPAAAATPTSGTVYIVGI